MSAAELTAPYRAIFEHTRDAVFVHDLSGHLTLVNRAGAHLLDYSPNDLLRLRLVDLVPEDHAGRMLEHVARTLEGEPPTIREMDALTQGGLRVPVEVSSVLVHDHGAPVSIHTTLRDISRRRRTEAALRASDERCQALTQASDERRRTEEALQSSQLQLQQSQKLEAVGQLAGGVAHDFNNLLTAMIGYSALALDGLDDASPLKSYIGEINRAAERAADLTRQLLAFSRKQILAPRVLDLNDVVADMSKMLRRMIGENIQLATLPASELGRVTADAGQIQQVIMNLVVNARDAMPGGGTVTIETANVHLTDEYARDHVPTRPGPYVMLAVSDTGMGMDAATRARMFEPFFTTKAVGRGTGLGLSTVYGIVKQSGGFIWVYSELSHGTAFKIYLPRIQDERTTLPAPLEEPPGRGSETVLIVEDDDVVRKLAKEILAAAGYEVLVAHEGEEAERLCREHRHEIHLLLSDVVIPGAGGREIAERLIKLRPEMKVLYMSGYAGETIVHQGVLNPGVKFLQKPFAPGALARRVREVLDAR